MTQMQSSDIPTSQWISKKSKCLFVGATLPSNWSIRDTEFIVRKLMNTATKCWRTVSKKDVSYYAECAQ